MECYFGSYERRDRSEDARKMVVCFAIPDAGIVFKAPFDAEQKLHTQYASLLTLLEFIELNQKIFKGKELKIFGDNFDLVEQVNQNQACLYEFTELLKKAIDYKKKFNYQIGWVPKGSNPSINNLFD